MSRKRLFLSSAVLFGFARLLLLSTTTFAAPVTSEVATSAFQGWRQLDPRPFGNSLSKKIKRAEAVKDSTGNTAYYVIHLDPSGYAIVSADDFVEPVVAFSARGQFNSAGNDTIAFLVNRDLPRRMARIRAGRLDAAASKARAKWNRFRAASPGASPSDSETNANIVAVSQVRVAPFVPTLWSQQTDESLIFACYNYYVPPGSAGDPNNYPCGCVATALAQVMYYFQYPTAGIGAQTYSYDVNGNASTGTTRGGNGSGGPYQWSQMPLNPNVPTTAQAQAIGALTYDAGIAVNMDYEADGSGADFFFTQLALTTTFLYSNAAYFENDSSGISGTNLLAMVNPNLDARLPVMLGIEPAGGHALLADGYGYSSSTLFHHLNCGWAGEDDTWYALPSIDTDVGDFTMIVACTYNIYTAGTGEIISGIVTDPTGAPIAGASITASRGAGGTYSATTDTNGIYALSRLPSNLHYTLTVAAAGDASAAAAYSTGTSSYDSCGNVWGANFVLSPPLLTVPETGFNAIGPVGGPFTTNSQAYALTNTSAASINWSLANTNSWLTASPSSGTLPPGSASMLTISLSAGADTLAAGTYSGPIWITNLGNDLSQQLEFTLAVKRGDYPISVSGFNQDVVVENGAVGGNSYEYATPFDPQNDDLGGAPLCFYESGLVATNFAGGGSAKEGLPQSGSFTSAVDNVTTFQFAPYAANNVLYLTPSASSGALTLAAPAAYKSLSVLAASAGSGGTGSLVIYFADGSSSSSINFNADDYFVTGGLLAETALAQFGIEDAGSYNEFYVFESGGYYPALYQTSINLQSLGLSNKAIASVTFTMPGGPTATGIFALSGTAAKLAAPPAPVAFLTGGNSLSCSGGQLTLQVTNPAQEQVIIAASTNLLQWVPVFTNPAGLGTFIYTDSAAGTLPRRFYRAVTP